MSFLSFAWDWLKQPQQWHGSDGIPIRILEQLYYTALSLVIAALIAIPVGILIGHTGRGAVLAVNLANAGRAIPTLGLLVLLAVWLGLLRRWPGWCRWSCWRSRRSWSTSTRGWPGWTPSSGTPPGAWA